MGAKELRSISASSDAPASAPDPASAAGDPALRSASIPAHGVDPAPPFASISHEALFAQDEITRCDACQAPLVDLDDAAGYVLQGRGVYLWRRGDETKLEDAPLCPACASAIGMTALARWEIEEEEG